MNEVEIVANVLAGVTEANLSLGTDHVVTHIRYIQNDTKPEAVYGYMARKLIEHLQAGGELSEAKPSASP